MSLNYSSLPTTTILNFNGGTSTALPVPSFICGVGNEITGTASSLTSSVATNITTAGTLVLRLDLAGGTVGSISVASYYAVRIA